MYLDYLDKLKKMKIAAAEDILFLHNKHLPYGNIIFDLGMEETRDLINFFLITMVVKM